MTEATTEAGTLEPVSDARRIVELRFKPLWLYVDAVREFCGFFTRNTFDDSELGERLGLVVHELVENAIRYGDQNSPEAELELTVARVPDAVHISVANTTRPEQARKLRHVFDKLREIDAEEAYKQALQRAIGLPDGESGIGLPRVRFEGGVDLDLELDADLVRVHAKGAI